MIAVAAIILAAIGIAVAAIHASQHAPTYPPPPDATTAARAREQRDNRRLLP